MVRLLAAIRREANSMTRMLLPLPQVANRVHGRRAVITLRYAHYFTRLLLLERRSYGCILTYFRDKRGGTLVNILMRLL